MSVMGIRIKEKRIEHQLTMDELAERLNVQKSAVSKWERGAVQNIRRSTIEKMAQIFNCSPAWLMGYDMEHDAAMEISGMENETIIEIVKNLPEDKKEHLLEYAKFLSESK